MNIETSSMILLVLSCIAVGCIIYSLIRRIKLGNERIKQVMTERDAARSAYQYANEQRTRYFQEKKELQDGVAYLQAEAKRMGEGSTPLTRGIDELVEHGALTYVRK